MSPARPRAVHATHADLATVGLVVAGAALLLIRLWLPALGTTGRLVGLALILLAVLAASLLVPATPDRARLNPAVVLAVGLVAVALAIVTGGRPVAAPYAAWALPLALLAAVAEEALFRRAAYGALQRHGAIVAVGATALAFALVHVPLYGVAAFPVDLGAGLLLSWQRWASGTWTVPAATHAVANLAMTVMR
ncbi:MAG: CPBP family glutamic-type intramembrane protease [Actinomycetota bacterium]